MWKLFCLLLSVHGEWVSCENVSLPKTKILHGFESSTPEKKFLLPSPTSKATSHQEVLSCLQSIAKNLPEGFVISGTELNQKKMSLVFPQCTIELDFLINVTKTRLQMEVENCHSIPMLSAGWCMITVSIGNFLCVWVIIWLWKALKEKFTQCRPIQEYITYDATTGDHRRGHIKHHIWSQICGSESNVEAV